MTRAHDCLCGGCVQVRGRGLGGGRTRARLYDPPLNVSHKHRYETSHIAFASYEGVIRVGE